MPTQINGFVKTCAPVFNSLTGSSVETSPTDFIPLVKKTSPSVCTLMATNNTIKVFIIKDCGLRSLATETQRHRVNQQRLANFHLSVPLLFFSLFLWLSSAIRRVCYVSCLTH